MKLLGLRSVVLVLILARSEASAQDTPADWIDPATGQRVIHGQTRGRDR